MSQESLFKQKKPRHWLVRPFYFLLNALRRLINPYLGVWLGRLIVKSRQTRFAYRSAIAGQQREPGAHSREEIMADVDAYMAQQFSELGIDPTGLSFEHRMIHSEDQKSTLDSFLVKSQSFGDLPPEDRHATLVLHGNTVRYEHDHALQKITHELVGEEGDLVKNRVVLTCNYTNVGFSCGPKDNMHTLFHSVLGQLRYLLVYQQVPAENITVLGHSFGGIVAQWLLAKAHASGYPIRACIDRSAPTIRHIVKGYVQEYFAQKGYPKTGDVLSTLAYPFIYVILKFGNHEKNVGKAYLTVGYQHSYIGTLRACEPQRSHHEFFKGGDRNIIHEASTWRYMKHRVQAGLKYSRAEFKRRIDVLLQHLDPEAHKDIIAKLTAWRQQFRRHKYYWPHDEEDKRHIPVNRDAHGRKMWELVNRFGGVNFHHEYRQFRDKKIEYTRHEQEEELDRLWDAFVMMPATEPKSRL